MSSTCLVLILVYLAGHIRSSDSMDEPGHGVIIEKFESLETFCAYGRVLVPHAQVLLSLPVCCLQLVCEFGSIVEKYHHLIGDTKCCEFAGLLYSDGAQMPGHCTTLICEGGQWVTNWNLDSCCKRCSLFNDPHIITFDDYRYDWHGTCNYSLAQSDLSYDPFVGVYADFQPCNRRASCLETTTFRENPHTVITLSSLSSNTMVVNGEEFEVPKAGIVPVMTSGPTIHPVLAWQSNGCIVLVGKSKLMIKHCSSSLHIWAHPSHADKLDGLCGHFSYHQADDFTNREGLQHPLSYRPFSFPSSWLAEDQCNKQCVHTRQSLCNECEEMADDPCKATQENQEEYAMTCQMFLSDVVGNEVVLLEHYIETCTFDLCMMHQVGTNAREIEDWLLELRMILHMIVDSENGILGRNTTSG